MKISQDRIANYFNAINEQILIINEILTDDNNKILQDKIKMNCLKYSVIMIAEAIGDILQHILAKKFSIAIDGYSKLINKTYDQNILSEKLFNKLKPFFNFRNMVVHRYWKIDNKIFLTNLKMGVKDFKKFQNEIKSFLKSN